MFDMFAAKLGEAQEFADNFVNLDALNMDRLRDEQERTERSKDESLRLLRESDDNTDGVSFSDSGMATPDGEFVSNSLSSNRPLKDGGGSGDGGGRGALGDIELPHLRTDSEQLEYLSSPNGFGSEGRNAIANAAASSVDGHSSFTAMEDGSNFEDEFDPILASIRKPPQKAAAEKTASVAAAATAGSVANTSQSFPGRGDRGGASSSTDPEDRGKSTASATITSGLLSIIPGNMRARAGDVMAQSSARISESAGAIRSALETGVPSATALGKKRQSDPLPPADGVLDLEEGRGGKAGRGRRTAGAGGDEHDVQMVSVNELLSDEERQQLAALADGAGGAGAARLCGWRRSRKVVPVVVVLALLGMFYLWRWTALTVGGGGKGLSGLDAERI